MNMFKNRLKRSPASESAAAPQQGISKKTKRWILAIWWSLVLGPIVMVWLMLTLARWDGLPSLEELENPQSMLASEIYTADGVMMGKYFRENRSTVSFNELSPYVVDCLVATEDERFYEHTGVDYEAVGRVVKGVLSGSTSQGGGSTISQQLAKMLFPREKLSKFGLAKRKFKEWIMATRLERNFTKEEIITMYLNKFDFINNAVGIKSAARIYFNTTPDSLKIEEAAMLVGMLQNPSLYNPVKFPERAKKRREVVLKQLLKNNKNPRIRTKITEKQYHELRQKPIELEYQRVDHAEGIAPYFREELRKELVKMFNEQDDDGNYVYHKKNGQPYDIYEDGLKIYTTIDSRMQLYGEYAVQEHLQKELQRDFNKDQRRWKRPPFANHVTEDKVKEVMETAMKRSNRYKIYTGKRCAYCERGKDYIGLTLKGNKKYYACSYCKHEVPVLAESDIHKMFETPYKMKVFSWWKPELEFDTTMTPMDSIRYYKKFLQAALISIEPSTGFVKAWVGGTNFRHFQYDHVRARRQVGSTFKPFVYAAAFRDRLFNPCETVRDIEHCIEVPFTKNTTKPWCPSNSGMKYTGDPVPLYFALPASMNNITAAIIKKEKPATVIKMLESMGIEKGYLPPVPSICLGTCELSPYEITGAQATFANKGIYIKPIYIMRVEDKNGNVIFEVEPQTSEAMDEITAYSMLQVMKGATSGVVNPFNRAVGGTAVRIRSSAKPYGGIKTPIAGKTGTTQHQTDGWFMGLTPDLVTGVWVGCDDYGVHFSTTQLGMGTNMALPIWGYFMKKVYADKKLKVSQGDFESPDNYHEMNCEDFQLGNSDLWKSIRTDEVETEGWGEGDDGDDIMGNPENKKKEEEEEEDPYDL